MSPGIDDAILDVLRQYWGFDALRPLQAEAIRAGLEQRDSVVVMPTGGGKSLCYQVPPIVAGRTDVVVSPLISLMKDQVDGLQASGYPAAAVHSNLSLPERNAIFDGIRAGAYRLLFVSPERLLTPGFTPLLHALGVRTFAIDEAHCISHWGHDFRPEYRQLARLKEHFPGASLHAFTATATPRVQGDIVEQLGLENPNVLVGASDRPNLTYRIVPRVRLDSQVVEILERHRGEAVIVYCLSRRDTETLAATLQANGFNAAAYHAGLDATTRRRTQDAFTRETLDVVVATVAFGMGIDRSDVRCVIHAAMPKSIEHYQQETGRAGRDGLEAECVLLYSAADVLRWKGLLERSRAEGEGDDEALAAQVGLLGHMQGLCSTLECRHRALSRYFGQPYERDGCGACDVCLDEVEPMADSTTITRKILACVARLEQRYGVGQVVQVLRGADTEQVRRWGHDRLSTYGILSELPEKTLTNLVYQLIDQDLLTRSAGDRPVLELTSAGVETMRGEREVRLVEPKSGRVRQDKASAESWEGVDRGLFEALRAVRRSLAAERGVPPYVVFGDEVLRAFAKVRPASPETMRSIKGVGEKKLADFAATFIEAIDGYCEPADLDRDVGVIARPAPRPRASRSSPQKERALEMFGEGASVEAVVEATSRKPATVIGYLAEFVESGRLESIDPWVEPKLQEQIADAARAVGRDRLKPIHDRLGGTVAYEAIKVVLAHRRAQEA
jgi:ATP-dependent DNA helicase RecQ